MIVYDWLNYVRDMIIINPFEWTVYWGSMCFFAGGYLEHIIEWWKPIREGE